ncbi:unnamed protein product, partial [Brenthis ino]
MMEQTGYSLPKRQQELNAKVKEAVLQNVDFNEIKSLEEKSDLDKLFKIDVASEYKEVAYIIEILTSGDPLYISRALRCTWLYDAEYMSIINPDYLQSNVFPLMSIKMIKKTLTTISKHIRDEERALSFYKYCRKIKWDNIAFKFLLFCSEKYKLEYLQTKDVDESKIAQFVGNSFLLAETYLDLEEVKYPITILLGKLCYLYSVCNETYLDLFESYCDYPSTEQFGLRISKNILTKHKQRVMKEPELYVKHLNTNMLIKYSTVEDAKFYLNALSMPHEVAEFWYSLREQTTKIIPILTILPENERLNFLTQIFMAKYPGEPFESSKMFYYQKLFKLMTFEEKEAWALKYLKENTKWLDKDQEFIWCKFVNFQLAFKAIKKYILVTTDCNKRSQMLDILIDVAGTEENLTKVMNYYYDRHINERENVKEEFVNKIYRSHNVFKFEESCWKVFNKILYSMKVYTKQPSYYNDEFRTICIVYHIINNKDVPDTLHAEKINESQVKYFELQIKLLTDDQNRLIYQYYLNLFTKTVETYEDREYDENIRAELKPILYGAILILALFKKTKADCPKVIMKYIKLDWSYFEELDFLSDEKISQGYLIRLLKQNAKLLLDKLPDVKAAFTRHYLNYISLRLNRVMKKIKVYFSNDFAKDVLNALEEWFLEMDRYTYLKLYHVTICSILQIADEDYKIKFISKYAPTVSKVAYDEIDHNILQIQANICRYAQYSRPPLPLQEILKYIKGDYVQCCLPMFESLTVNLPRPLACQFIEANLDCPVSIQKHGIRLAFHYFNIKRLEKFILDNWGNTKNVFLRKVIYKALFYRVVKDENANVRFYELLKMITSELNEDDDDDIFNLFSEVTSLPKALKSDYLEVAWTTVEKLPNKSLKNVDRQCGVIITIRSNIHIMNKEFCREQILDEFVKSMLFERKIHEECKNRETEILNQEKWNLAVAYITHFDNSEQLTKRVELASVIIKKCVEMWDYSHERVYTIRQFIMEFLNNLLNQAYRDDDKVTPVLQSIINQLEQSLPIKQIYLLYCKLNFAVISKQVMGPKKIESNSGEINYSHLKMEDVAANFTDKLVKFLISLKRHKMLYISCYSELAFEITNVLDTMTYDTKWKSKDLSIEVCDRLTDIQRLETFTIATIMIPMADDEKMEKNISKVINKIIEYDHDELEVLLWNKMMNNNYKVFLTDNTKKKARNPGVFYFYIFLAVCAAMLLMILNPFKDFFFLNGRRK